MQISKEDFITLCKFMLHYASTVDNREKAQRLIDMVKDLEYGEMEILEIIG